jgi:hypothetical protein
MLFARADVPYSQDLANQYSTVDHNVTINQLLGWNVGLQGSCDNLYRQIVCTGLVLLWRLTESQLT